MDETPEDSTGRPWPQEVHAITLVVENLEAARRFYQEVFRLPVTFETEDSVVFSFGNIIINLLQVASAGELVAPAAVASDAAG